MVVQIQLLGCAVTTFLIISSAFPTQVPKNGANATTATGRVASVLHKNPLPLQRKTQCSACSAFQPAHVPPSSGRTLRQVTETVTCSFNISSDSASIACVAPGALTLSTDYFPGDLLTLSGVKKVTTAKCSATAGLGSVLTLCCSPAVNVIFELSSVTGDFTSYTQKMVDSSYMSVLAIVSGGGLVQLQDSVTSEVQPDVVAISVKTALLSVKRCKFSYGWQGLYWESAPDLARDGATDAEILDAIFHGMTYNSAFLMETLPAEAKDTNTVLRSTLLVRNTSFTAHDNPGDLGYAFGGGIALYGGNFTNRSYNFTFSNSIFENCSAVYGGAIALDLGANNNTIMSITTINTIFSSCKAAVGGAVYLNYTQSSNTSISITSYHTTFQNNSASTDHYSNSSRWNGCGGAMVIDNSDYRATPTNSNCTESCKVSFQGTNTTFIRNTANSSGGALVLDGMYGLRNSIKLTGNDLYFRQNTGSTATGTDYGGAVLAAAAGSNRSSITVDGTRMVFTDNWGGFGGALVLQTDASSQDVTIKVQASELLVSGNTAVVGGGLAILSGSSNNIAHYIRVRNLTFINNIASAAGALYIDATNSTGSVDIKFPKEQMPATGASCMFFNNTAIGGPGGAVVLLQAPLPRAGLNRVWMEGCQFESNSAVTAGGGAIYHYGQVSLPSLSVSTDENSEAGENEAGVTGLILRDMQIVSNTALNGGGIFLRNSTCTLTQVAFTGNTAGMFGGAMYARSMVNITSCVFDRNKAVQGGALYGTAGDAGEINMINLQSCELKQNAAETDGGALFLSAGSTQLSDCTVQDNSATSRGGAIYFSNICRAGGTGAILGSGECEVTMDPSTHIFKNHATSGGGMFVTYPFTSSRLLTKSYMVSVQNNTAEFSPDVATAPEGSALEVMNLNMNASSGFDRAYPSTIGLRGQIPLKVRVNGNLTGVRVQVDLLSETNTMSGSNITALSWSTNNAGKSVYLTGFIVGTDKHGIADFADLHIIGAAPNTESQTYTLKVWAPDFQHVQQRFASVDVRGCVLGEARVRSSAAGTAATCDVCVNGSYAVHVLQRSTTSCIACPPGNTASCMEGIITPTVGHWQGAVGSDVIQVCPNLAACKGITGHSVHDEFNACLRPDNTSCTSSCQKYLTCAVTCTAGDAQCLDRCSTFGACLAKCAGGGACATRGYSDMFCSPGYQGYLCGSCRKGYGAYKIFRCGKCLARGLVWVLYALALMAACLIVVYISYSVVNSLGDDGDDLRAPDVFKVLAMHMQMLAVVSSLLVDWPPVLKGLFEAVQFVLGPSQSGVLSPACLGVSSTDSGKLWLSLLVPVFVVLLTMPLWLLVKRLVQNVQYDWLPPQHAPKGGVSNNILNSIFAMQIWSQIGFRHLVFASSLVCVFFMYTFIVSTAFAPLTCLTVAYTGKAHWASNMDVQCWTKRHVKAVLAPASIGVVFSCIAVPLGIFFCGRSYHSSVQHFTPKIQNGFLFRQYRTGMWYWELYNCLHIAGMVAVSMFARVYGSYHQLLLFMLLLMTNSTLTHTLHPFGKRVVHVMHVSSISIMLLTVTAVLAIKDADQQFSRGENESLQFTTFQDTVSILTSVINVGFVAWGVVVLAAVQGHEMRRKRGSTGRPGRVAALLLKVEGFVTWVMACESIDQPSDLHIHKALRSGEMGGTADTPPMTGEAAGAAAPVM